MRRSEPGGRHSPLALLRWESSALDLVPVQRQPASWPARGIPNIHPSRKPEHSSRASKGVRCIKGRAMNQEFDQANNVLINRDDKGVARDLLHTEEPFVSQASTPQLAAAEYLEKFGGLLGLGGGETDNLNLAPAAAPTDVADDLRFQGEKSQFDTTTVLYQQPLFGLPIGQGGVAIHVRGKPSRAHNPQSTRHADVDAELPSASALSRLENLNE